MATDFIQMDLLEWRPKTGRTINHFIMTSADDCKISLQFTTADDLPLLNEALLKCYEMDGQKTKIKLIASRIAKLKRM